MPSPESREDWILREARKRSAAERAVFLDGACGEDEALRQKVEFLLSTPKPSDTATSPEGEAAKPTLKLDFTETPDTAVGQMIGRYKILEKIGEGGCGMVYVAEQTEPVRRRVALKVIKLGMDTKAVVARFEAERQALAMMDHPNIAKVLDAGTTEAGRPYFVMELVRGIKITDYCDQHQLPTRERLDLFVMVCQAIQHAHQKGIIHRDIKPSNILVTLHDGVPVPKVIDFGIAKATEGRLTDATIYTQLHQFIGTPAYMSPEQAEMSGLDIDTRSDIYSLGVLLYELLTGRTPFDSRELASMGLDAMRKTIREKDPVRPSTRLATLPGEELTTTAKRRSVETYKLAKLLRGDLDWIAMKCLEKDRTRRYETANGLGADLRHHLNNEPVVARPPSKLYEFQKMVRRHKVGFAAAGAIMLVLSAGVLVSTWQALRATQAKREALFARHDAETKAEEANASRTLAAQQRDLANQRLYESLLREVRSIRKARQVGYRREVFDRIKQAAVLDVGHKDLTFLRREAAASFGDWVGLDPVDINMAGGADICAISEDGTLMAMAASNGATVSLYETRTGRDLATLDTGGFLVYSLTFDQKGTSLWMSVFDEPVTLTKRPGASHLEKWSLRGDGSWKQDWSRPSKNVLFYSATKEGPVALELLEQDVAFSIKEPDGVVELARISIDKPMPWFPSAAVSRDRAQFAYFNLAVTNSLDEELQLRDLKTGKRQTLATHQGTARAVYFSEDGQTLVVSFAAKTIAYDTAQLSPLFSSQGTFEDNWGAVPGGGSDLLALPAVQELGVRLIQMNSAHEQAFLDLPGTPKAQCFSRDGSVLVVTHRKGARVFHLQAEREKTLLEGHQGGVPAVEFLPDGRRLISTGKDRTLRLWNLNSGQSRILAQLPVPGQTLSLSPDGAVLACGSYDISEISLWSLPAGNQLGQLEQAVHLGTTWKCAFSPQGSELAAVGLGLTVWKTAEWLKNPTNMIEQISLRVSQTNGYAGVSFDPAGKYLAYVGGVDGNNQLLIRSMATEVQPQIIATNIQVNPVQPLCFLPKSGRLAYVTREREIAILEPGTWRVINRIATLTREDKPEWYVANLTVSPDESRFAMLEPSGLGVELRDTVTGALVYALPEQAGTVWWLAWSPDSTRLAVTRANGEIAVWNLKEVEAQLAQLGLKP